MTPRAARLARFAIHVVAPEAAVLARLSERDLLEMVRRHAKKHGVTVADICGRGRSSAVAAARHAVWCELRDTTAMSYPEIGKLFARDHSTVMTACASPGRVAAKRLEDKIRAGLPVGARSFRAADVRSVLRVI